MTNVAHIRLPALAAFLAIALHTASAAPTLSPQAAALIAPVQNAFLSVRNRQQRAGKPKSVADQLIRLAALDQAGRNVIATTDLTPLPPAQRDAASSAAWAEIDAQDTADLKALKALMPRTGWFSIAAYGAPASHAAWIVAQHQTANAPFMADVLSRMQPLAEKGQVSAADYSLLVDRVAMLQNRPQLYGSQFVCRNHKWILYTLADPAHVDDRRKAIGVTKPESASLAEIAAMPPCYFAPDK